MKATGMVRRVDELGRIVIPVELRRVLDLEEKDELEIYMEEGNIIIQKYQQNCLFCGSETDIHFYKTKVICQGCAQELHRQLT